MQDQCSTESATAPGPCEDRLSFVVFSFRLNIVLVYVDYVGVTLCQDLSSTRVMDVVGKCWPGHVICV